MVFKTKTQCVFGTVQIKVSYKFQTPKDLTYTKVHYTLRSIYVFSRTAAWQILWDRNVVHFNTALCTPGIKLLEAQS